MEKGEKEKKRKKRKKGKGEKEKEKKREKEKRRKGEKGKPFQFLYPARRPFQNCVLVQLMAMVKGRPPTKRNKFQDHKTITRRL